MAIRESVSCLHRLLYFTLNVHSSPAHKLVYNQLRFDFYWATTYSIRTQTLSAYWSVCSPSDLTECPSLNTPTSHHALYTFNDPGAATDWHCLRSQNETIFMNNPHSLSLSRCLSNRQGGLIECLLVSPPTPACSSPQNYSQHWWMQ